MIQVPADQVATTLVALDKSDLFGASADGLQAEISGPGEEVECPGVGDKISNHREQGGFNPSEGRAQLGTGLGLDAPALSLPGYYS